jgi:acetylornithine/succinyldiaminopimelate/putrescine aminotransferase
MSKSADLVEQVVHETLRTMPFLTFKDPDQQPGKAPDIMSAKVQRSLQHTGTVSRPALITVDEAKRLDLRRVANLFAAHLNPGQLHFMKLLGFHKVIIESAEGMYYIDREGRRILDFFGGFGSLAFGHNHPRILSVRKAFQDEKRHEIAMAFLSQYASALAHNLAQASPGDLDMVFLGSSGSEAMEAALKLAEQAQGPERNKIVYAENSFHGKTRGALSVTDGPLYRSGFALVENTRRVPFGDINAIARALEDNSSIGTVVLETIQGGGGIVTAPPDFWPALRALCDAHEVLWIADEVQCGLGRTGRFYAFEHYGVVPDITALAKSLGGGKCAMAAMIARRGIYMKAYGEPKTALIHGPATFGGIGEACCTAIEALNILYDEGLMENATARGEQLIARLETLRKKYPKIIKEVRGKGLMVGLEFHDFSTTLPFGLRQAVSVLDDKLKGSLCGFVGSLLLADYDILVAFTEYNRNVIRLEPPLICEAGHVDAFADAMDDLLGRGIVRIVTDFIKRYAKAG